MMNMKVNGSRSDLLPSPSSSRISDNFPHNAVPSSLRKLKTYRSLPYGVLCICTSSSCSCLAIIHIPGQFCSTLLASVVYRQSFVEGHLFVLVRQLLLLLLPFPSFSHCLYGQRASLFLWCCQRVSGQSQARTKQTMKKVLKHIRRYTYYAHLYVI